METLWTLGVALGVPVSRLVDPPRPDVRVIRAGEGPGDYVVYPGDVPHVFDGLEPDTTAVIVMEHV